MNATTSSGSSQTAMSSGHPNVVGLPTGRGHELRVFALEEPTSEEDHRAAHLVERETVLGGVGEDLLFGTGTPGA